MLQNPLYFIEEIYQTKNLNVIFVPSTEGDISEGKNLTMFALVCRTAMNETTFL